MPSRWTSFVAAPPGWTVFAVDRESRRWAVAQARRQQDAAETAYGQLYR